MKPAKRLAQKLLRAEYDDEHPAPSEAQVETMFVDAHKYHVEQQQEAEHREAERLTRIQQLAAEKEGTKPIQYCIGWSEIMAAIDRHDDASERSKIRHLNELHDGPIMSSQGAPPKAVYIELIEWWNGLKVVWRAQQEKRQSRAASVENTYRYGRDGEVAPEIGGSIKHRKTNQPHKT